MNQKAYFIEPIRVRPQISEGTFYEAKFSISAPPHTHNAPPTPPRSTTGNVIKKSTHFRKERGAEYLSVHAFEICYGFRKGFVKLLGLQIIISNNWLILISEYYSRRIINKKLSSASLCTSHCFTRISSEKRVLGHSRDGKYIKLKIDGSYFVAILMIR